MGSTGSGRFSDYSNAKQSGSGTGSGSGGGASGTDRCLQAFSCRLEEVSLCDYFDKTKDVPSAKTALRLILDGRLFAADSNGIKIGALPTSFNYLAACLEAGISYIGIVTSSALSPTPSVVADFTPEKT